MSGQVLTQFPFRASADIAVCRVVTISGQYTVAQATDKTKMPVGVSAEWSFQAPLVDYGITGQVHARGTQKDPVSLYGRGQKAHVEVGATAISAAGPVMADADGSGKVVPAVAPCWVVGYVGEPAPVGSRVEILVDPVYVPTGGTF